MKPEFTYKAEVIRVVDGDTVWLEVDLGFRTFTREAFRLLGINAPELGKPGGTASREYLEGLLTLDVYQNGDPMYKPVVIKTFKNPRDKYGRWLCEIECEGIFINSRMVEDGHAILYK